MDTFSAPHLTNPFMYQTLLCSYHIFTYVYQLQKYHVNLLLLTEDHQNMKPLTCFFFPCSSCCRPPIFCDCFTWIVWMLEPLPVVLRLRRCTSWRSSSFIEETDGKTNMHSLTPEANVEFPLQFKWFGQCDPDRTHTETTCQCHTIRPQDCSFVVTQC